MPRYLATFAYDVPHYFDFEIEAPSKRVANAQCVAALKTGAFNECIGQPDEGGGERLRAFVMERLEAPDTLSHELRDGAVRKTKPLRLRRTDR